MDEDAEDVQRLPVGPSQRLGKQSALFGVGVFDGLNTRRHQFGSLTD